MDAFNNYLETISRWPLLTPAQEIELSRLKQAGINRAKSIGTCKPTRQDLRVIKRGERSVERMVLCNLRLVVSIAKNYVRHCNTHTIEDLVQYGSIGLKRAIEKFDHEKGYKLSTYATWWIKQEIHRGIYKADRTIRLPEHCRQSWARLRKHSNDLTQKLGRAPTQDELIATAEMSKKDYALITRAMEGILSLNSPMESGAEIIEYLPDCNNRNEIATDYTALLDTIELLRDDERELINRYYGLNGYPADSMVEISKQRGTSRQAVKNRLDRIQANMKFRLSAYQQ
jgi:RNA polymerase sigma factor (sigma-70 family)